MTKKLNRN